MNNVITIYGSLVDLSKIDMIDKPIAPDSWEYVQLTIYFSSKNTNYFRFHYDKIIDDGHKNKILRKYTMGFIELEYKRLTEYINSKNDKKELVFFDIDEMCMYVKNKLGIKKNISIV